MYPFQGTLPVDRFSSCLVEIGQDTISIFQPKPHGHASYPVQKGNYPFLRLYSIRYHIFLAVDESPPLTIFQNLLAFAYHFHLPHFAVTTVPFVDRTIIATCRTL